MPPRRHTTTAATPAISEERAGVLRNEVAGLLREARAACPDDAEVGAEVAWVAGRLVAACGGDREAVGKLGDLVSSLSDAGAHGVAVAVAHKAAQIGEEAWGARAVGNAWSLCVLAYALRRAGEDGSEEVGALLELADQIHDRWRETYPWLSGSILSRSICYEMGMFQLAKGRGREAATCARRYVRMAGRVGKNAQEGELAEAHELLGDALSACSKHEEAREAYEKCMQLSEEWGKDMKVSGDHKGAVRAYRRCMRASGTAHGPAAAETLHAAVRLAGCMEKLGDTIGAAEVLRPVVAGYSDGLEAAGMPDDVALAIGLMATGSACSLLGLGGVNHDAAAEGAEHYRRAFLFYCRAHGRHHDNAVEALVGLGCATWNSGNADDAEPLLRRGLQLARGKLGHAKEVNLSTAALAGLLERRIEQLPPRTALRTRLRRDLHHYLQPGRPLPAACSLPTCSNAQMQGQPNFKVCTKCAVVRYCSRECLLADWERGHSEACTIARRVEREGVREREGQDGSTE